MDVPVPYLPEHAADFVGERSRQQWSSQQAAPFAIGDMDHDQVLGSCGLVGVTAKDLVAEVVCAVAPWARGRKVAQRAVRLLCDWAFTDVGLPGGVLRRTVERGFASRGCPTRLSVRRGSAKQGADSRVSQGHGALRAPQAGALTRERGRESRRIMREAAESLNLANSLVEAVVSASSGSRSQRHADHGHASRPPPTRLAQEEASRIEACDGRDMAGGARYSRGPVS